MAGPVRELRLLGPDEDASTCPRCLGRLLPYLDDPSYGYCPVCRHSVMVIDGEALEEVA